MLIAQSLIVTVQPVGSSFGYYYSPYYSTYSYPCYSNYGTYRPRFGLYLGF